MKSAKLKICGITSPEDAFASIECGAQYLGFNFYADSPRYITPHKARSIAEQLPDEVMTVGIFVNEPEPEDVIRVLDMSGVRLAQLHGDESPEYCEHVGRERVIKALRAGPDFDINSVLDYPATAILLDAYDRNLYGGTGRIANWAAAVTAARMVRLFLAGGLSPANIYEAVLAVEPYAVDVNSGVESAPGVKDPQKLRELKKEMERV